MLKVQIDVSQMHVLNRERGVGMYTNTLVEHLQKSFPQDQIELVEKHVSTTADIVHYPYFDLHFHTLPLRKKGKTVVTIHDVIPLLYPKQYPPGLRGSFAFMRQLVSLKSVDAVVTDSECSKSDIAKHLGIPQQKIHVVYLAGNPKLKPQGDEEIAQVRTKYSLPEKYFLYVGDINYNKNLPTLIEAASALPAEYSLVMVGRSLNNTAIPEGKALHEALKKFNMVERTTLLTDVPKEPASELAAIFSGAVAYVQPSLYEGFGLSVLDAMQCGTPVVTSRTSSLREVAGDAAIYFHPKSAQELTDAMNKATSLSATDKKSLLAKAKVNLKKFDWDTTAKRTHEIYSSVVSAK